MAFNVGRFASRTVCSCFYLGPPRVPQQGAECSTCGLLIPVNLDSLTLQERLEKVEHAPVGTPISLYGLFFTLTEEHVRPSTVAKWQKIGDPLADAAIKALHERKLPRTLAGLEAAEKAGDAACAALLNSVRKLPPWADWARIAAAGQTWFLHLLCFAITLLNLSLLGSYTAPAINDTLVVASRLMGPRDSVYRRIVETLEFVDNVCSPGALEPGGRGWKSAIEVRLLHAGARARTRAAHESGVRVRECPFGGGGSDPASGDDPVSAAYVMVTQLALSILMLMGAERAGLLWHVSDDDAGNICHLYAVVGWLLGLPEDLSAAPREGSLPGCQVLIESLFVSLVAPHRDTKPLAIRSLRACAWRAPFPMSPADMVATTHALAGPRMAELSMPSFNDPELQEEIVDENPTVSLRTEMSHVKVKHAEKAVDASQRLHRQTWSQWAEIQAEVLIFQALALLMSLASLSWWLFDTLMGHPQHVVYDNYPAATRGRYMLSLHRCWPVIASLLPPWALKVVSDGLRVFLVRFVERRLGYHKW